MADEVQKVSTVTRKAGVPAGKYLETLQDGIVKSNPIIIQVLGICSCLAVTNRLNNALVMGLALIFVTGMSNLFVSLLRNTIPRRTRMIAEVAIISTFVIVFDQFLRAFYWDMSKQLGPYVGLIITNCIVMGRAEAFGLQNPPFISLIDGIANGIGYTIILALVAFFRELIGAGSLFGLPVLSEAWYPRNLLFVLAPGAFFTAGLLIWIINRFVLKKPADGEEKKSSEERK
ncbi:MAG: NADH:ubiquinone reductase (Na(+)-transporting) subunit D [Spirochaetota bacterium]